MDHKRIPNGLLWAIIAIAFIGFLDATYLTVSHYAGTDLECSIGDCNTVTTSKYAVVYGFPVALGGALYYLVTIFLALFYYDRGKRIAISIFRPLALLAFLASIWFVYIQLFVLNAICIYCMGSAATSTLLFILSLFTHRYTRNLT